MAVITISRQLGSGGNEIATLVADQLNYRYFDKRLLIEAAAETGLAKEHVVDFSEEHYEVRSFLSRLFRSGPRPVKTVSVRQRGTAGTPTLSEETIDEVQYVELIKRSIRVAYEAGDIVIVGRGGQAVLQDEPNVLHIRVVAPLGVRIARLQEQAELTVEDAQRKLSHQDRATAEYLGRFFGVRWEDATLYGLTINTNRLSIETAAQVVVDAVVSMRAPVE